MASTGDDGRLPPNFMLTPQQQSLLFAALNSNKPRGAASPASAGVPNGLSLSPTAFKNSPVPTSDMSNFQESPFLDNYEYDFGDNSFDFSFANENTVNSVDAAEPARSESSENDGNDKRSLPDDEREEENEPKRRESSDKVPKKPGRKPLTSEPSSKRKAQNRAAQRAFRERKEKHVKDLEIKVDELQKASEAANHENSKLKAQVERMTSELNQYKQKMSVMSNTKPLSNPMAKGFGNAATPHFNDVNFQFNFPKFGSLPGPNQNKQRSVSSPISPQQSTQAPSPSKSRNDSSSPSAMQQQQDQLFKDDLSKFSGIFTPSMASTVTNGSHVSLDSASYGMGGATSSPSASSNSNAGPSSSCGTSPEPFTQSPMQSKPLDTMTTIGEEQSTLPTDQGFASFANLDFSSSNFDWLTKQNGGQFDPQLFGDYREPQENILANGSFDDFFNDAVDADFFTPYNIAPTPAAPKKNLIDEIDAQKDSVDDDLPKKQNMNCNQIWEKLQACPSAQSGEFDLDGLCSELTKKAKCSGSGPVVGEQDFDSILKKYMGNVSADCVASTLGIEVNKTAKPNGVGMP